MYCQHCRNHLMQLVTGPSRHFITFSNIYLQLLGFSYSFQHMPPIAISRVNVSWNREVDSAVCLTVGVRMNSGWLNNAKYNSVFILTNFVVHSLLAGFLHVLLIWNSFIIRAPLMVSICWVGTALCWNII